LGAEIAPRFTRIDHNAAARLRLAVLSKALLIEAVALMPHG